MSLRKYGICLAFKPGVDLKKEGLGRYLAAFIKGGANIPNLHWIIVCPNWGKESLEQLFQSENIIADNLTIVSPAQKAFLWSAFILWEKYFNRFKTNSTSSGIGSFFKRIKTGIYDRVLDIIASATTLTVLFCIPPLILLLALVVPLVLIVKIIRALLLLPCCKKIYSKLRAWIIKFLNVINLLTALNLLKNKLIIFDLYEKMEKHEIKRMQRKIKKFSDVIGWYCPTAFWPSFAEMDIPILTCVPDDHVSVFPIGFAKVGSFSLLHYKETVEKTIKVGKYFVTYSEFQKWDMLVGRHSIPPSNVFVVKHANNDLNPFISATEDSYADFAKEVCKKHLSRALAKSKILFKNNDVKFLFYASQFRPNKNLITLLRAYNYLLRTRLFQQKLILTGNIDVSSEVKKFISDHRLENDVLFLHNLSTPELASCYKLADLAICPSLAEGGAPFTFSEALSVKTPSLIARIGVSEELITDLEIRDLTLFDPYSYRDLASKIEYALHNRSYLLDKQLQYYNSLNRFTWNNVVSEHLAIMDKISIAYKEKYPDSR